MAKHARPGQTRKSMQPASISAGCDSQRPSTGFANRSFRSRARRRAGGRPIRPGTPAVEVGLVSTSCSRRYRRAAAGAWRFHRGACCPARRCAGDRRGTVRQDLSLSPVVGASRGQSSGADGAQDGGLRDGASSAASRRLRVIACCPLAAVRAPMRRKWLTDRCRNSETGLTKVRGAGLVTQRPDPMELRKHRVTLTAKGIALAHRLVRTLDRRGE